MFLDADSICTFELDRLVFMHSTLLFQTILVKDKEVQGRGFQFALRILRKSAMSLL